MRVLVTGAAGFIGFHVAAGAARPRRRGDGLRRRQRLLRPGAQGGPPRRARPGGGRPRARTGASCGPISPTAPRSTAAFAGDGPFDRVIHLAAQAGVRYSLENPVAYVTSNVLGFTHVLEACRRAATPHLVFASTSSVYGANRAHALRRGPGRRPPAAVLRRDQAGERADGACLQPSLRPADAPACASSPSTAPGGGPTWRRCSSPTRSSPAGRSGSSTPGRHSRDFTYVDDIVEGVIRAADRDRDARPRLGPGRPRPGDFGRALPHLQHRQRRPGRALDFIAALERALGRTAIRELLPLQPGDVPDTWADCTRLAGRHRLAPRDPGRRGRRPLRRPGTSPGGRRRPLGRSRPDARGAAGMTCP